MFKLILFIGLSLFIIGGGLSSLDYTFSKDNVGLNINTEKASESFSIGYQKINDTLNNNEEK